MSKKTTHKSCEIIADVSDCYAAKMSGNNRTQHKAELMIGMLCTLQVQRDLLTGWWPRQQTIRVIMLLNKVPHFFLPLCLSYIRPRSVISVIFLKPAPQFCSHAALLHFE